MSTFKHPVGSQPPGVYWRRRLIVVLILLVIIVVIVLLVARPGSHHPAVTPTPTSTAAAAPATPQASAAGNGTCSSSSVSVQAITDQAAYSAGQIPQLSMSVTNVGSKPCSLDAGTAQQVFTISSGSETYWTSTDCQTGGTDQLIELKPGKTITSQTPIVWDRTRSSPSTCKSTAAPVPAAGASYHLSVSVGGIKSQNSKQFILE